MQQFFEFPVTSLCTFDSFVVCDGNAGALQFARRIADPDDPENLLYIYGPAGSGKTHLLKAIGQVMGGNSQRAVPCLSFREPATADDVCGRFARAEALIVDDLHLMPDDGGLRAALWQVFNDFHSSGRKIAMPVCMNPANCRIWTTTSYRACCGGWWRGWMSPTTTPGR